MRDLFEVLFWCSAIVLVYTYVGYPILVMLYSHVAGRPSLRGKVNVRVSIIIAVHNEARYLRRKLDNLTRVLKNESQFEIIVVSDGSSDQTVSILMEAQDARLRYISITPRQGKAVALNTGVTLASGDILIFTDARQLLEDQSIANLLRNFADPAVGGVTGQLMLGDLNGAEAISGESVKTALESRIRKAEGLVDSSVGSAGAFHAIRRTLFSPLPAGTLLDDMWIPLSVIHSGFRVVFDAEARIWDDFVPTMKQEFSRKVRTLTGNYQLLHSMPWLLSFKNRLLVQFVSHKILRLASPLALLLLLISSTIGAPQYLRLFLWAQIGFYSSTIIYVIKSPDWLHRLGNVSLTFVLLNVAALVAIRNAIFGKVHVWAK